MAEMTLPGARFVGMTIRFAARLIALACWCLGALAAMVCASGAGLISEPFGRRACRGVSRTWARGMLRLLGTRIIVRGTVPKRPYFLVGNHVAWMDFFVANTILDAACVVKADIVASPLSAFMLKGLDLIIVSRGNNDILKANASITRSMEAGKNIVFAPEGTVAPGKRVCHFHSALLEPAARAGRPVYCAALSIRTPDGWPSPSEAILTTDADFYVRNPTDEELRLADTAREKGLVRYLFGFLGLPWHEYVITFRDQPIACTGRKALARSLEEAIQGMLAPMK